MGCAASSDRAERRRRRGRALGHSEASTNGLLLAGQDHQEPAWKQRRGCCKVAPEPEEDRAPPEPVMTMPGSPSFRYYCQKAATVDALVAEAEAEGFVRITETLPETPITTNELAAEDTSKSKIVEASKPKQVNRWLRFRGLAIVAAAWYNLFNRNRSKALSTPLSPTAAKSQPPAVPAAPAPAAAATPHT